MKRWPVFILLLFSEICRAQISEVHWNDQYQKELHITCSAQEEFCKVICDASSFCVIEEKSCTSCIGSNLPMHHLFTELGRSVRSHLNPVSFDSLANLIKSGNFATFSARDVYNVIDGYSSIGVFKKFESLCPGESLTQLIFVELAPLSRRLHKVKYVSCQYEDGSALYELQDGLFASR